jgi:hypothetical protein
VIDVFNDAEGVRMALEEIFEQDFVRARIQIQSAGANAQTKERMLSQIPTRTLSPGYYAFALHLLQLEAEGAAGVGFDAARMPAYEARGLVALRRARDAFASRHPACSACKTRQQNRFSVKCDSCGVKFQKKK